MTRRKYTSKFKIKVVSEALEERSRVAEPAQKYELDPGKQVCGNEILWQMAMLFLRREGSIPGGYWSSFRRNCIYQCFDLGESYNSL